MPLTVNCIRGKCLIVCEQILVIYAALHSQKATALSAFLATESIPRLSNKFLQSLGGYKEDTEFCGATSKQRYMTPGRSLKIPISRSKPGKNLTKFHQL